MNNEDEFRDVNLRLNILVVGRHGIVVHDVCERPCEECGIHDPKAAVVNVMPDGCIAPSRATGGRCLCFDCMKDRIVLDGTFGHLTWIQAPFRGYILHRVVNVDMGSDKHPGLDCTFFAPYMDQTLKNIPPLCVRCWREVPGAEYFELELRAGSKMKAGIPAMADFKSFCLAAAPETLEFINGLEDSFMPIRDADSLTQAKMRKAASSFMLKFLAGSQDILHKGNGHVLKTNGIKPFAR